MKEKILKLYDASPLCQPDTSTTDVQYNSDSLYKLMAQLKAKLALTEGTNEKIKLLTLVPQHWTRKRTMEVFGVTEYMVRQAKKLLIEKGILGEQKSERNVNKKLDDETRSLVIEFYLKDENSRLLPGKKKHLKVSTINGREQMQKSFFLCNLEELYVKWKEDHGDKKVGFAMFARLRLAWCVLAGSSGTHTVCVCVHHQNPKLKFQVFTEPTTCTSLMAETVCNLESRTCMMKECNSCPGVEPLKDHIAMLVPDDDDIQYLQLISTDRYSLKTVVQNQQEFVEELAEDLHNLTKHHYTAKKVQLSQQFERQPQRR